MVEALDTLKSERYMKFIAAERDLPITQRAIHDALVVSMVKFRAPSFKRVDSLNFDKLHYAGTLPNCGFVQHSFKTGQMPIKTVVFVWCDKEFRLIADFDISQHSELEELFAVLVRPFLDNPNADTTTFCQLQTSFTEQVSEETRLSNAKWFEKSGFQKFEDFYNELSLYHRALCYFTLIFEAVIDGDLANFDDNDIKKYRNFTKSRSAEFNSVFDRINGVPTINREDSDDSFENISVKTPNIDAVIEPQPLDLSDMQPLERPLTPEEIVQILSPFIQEPCDSDILFKDCGLGLAEIQHPVARLPSSPVFESPEEEIEQAPEERQEQSDSELEQPAKTTKKRKATTPKETQKPKAKPKKKKVLNEISDSDQLRASRRCCWTCGMKFSDISNDSASKKRTAFCPRCSAFISRKGRFIESKHRYMPSGKVWCIEKYHAKLRSADLDLTEKSSCKKRCGMCLRNEWKIEKYREFDGTSGYARDICYLCKKKLKYLENYFRTVGKDSELSEIDLTNPKPPYECFKLLCSQKRIKDDCVDWNLLFPKAFAVEKKRKPSGRNSGAKRRKINHPKVAAQVPHEVINLESDIEEEEVQSSKRQKVALDIPEQPIRQERLEDLNIGSSIEEESPEEEQEVPVEEPSKKPSDPNSVHFRDDLVVDDAFLRTIPDCYNQDDLGKAIQLIFTLLVSEPHRDKTDSLDECFVKFRNDLHKIQTALTLSSALNKFGLLGVVLLVEQLRKLCSLLWTAEARVPRMMEGQMKKLQKLRTSHATYWKTPKKFVNSEQLLTELADLTQAANRDAHNSLLVALFMIQ